MDYCQKQLIVPDGNPYLIRYMSEWKFDSFFSEGIPFTSMKKQVDKREGIIDGKRNGYVRFINDSDFLENNYISCWSIEDTPNFEKFKTYNCWRNFNGSNNRIAFAIKVSCDSLIRYAKACCNLINGAYHYANVHNLYYGKVVYPSEIGRNSHSFDTQEGINYLFRKDAKFTWEQEFRLVLALTTHKTIYNETTCNYMVDLESSPFMPLATFPEPIFPCDVFIFNQLNNHISKSFSDLQPAQIAINIKNLDLKNKCLF